MKKLLLITEDFYEYDIKMKQVIENLGYDVTLFPIRIPESYVAKVLHRGKIKQKQYREAQQKKRQQFLKKDIIYDVVLVIAGHSLDVELFLEFRKKQKNAQFILYLWDDVKRVATYKPLKHVYDRILTFDRKDAIQYQLEFRPLFYVDDYVYRKEVKQYDMCFVGSIHSNRKAFINEVIHSSFEKNCNAFIYLYTGWFTTIKNRFYNKNNPEYISPTYLFYKKLSFAKSAEAMRKSKVVLDIQYPTQCGLTMRTIESLAAHTKIATTNPEVKEYDFYHKDNILIIDREQPVIDAEWLEMPWHEIEPDIMNKYSVSAWAEDVLEGSKDGVFLRKL